MRAHKMSPPLNLRRAHKMSPYYFPIFNKMRLNEAVKIETIFITKSISCAILGMNVTTMKQIVGNRLIRLVKF